MGKPVLSMHQGIGSIPRAAKHKKLVYCYLYLFLMSKFQSSLDFVSFSLNYYVRCSQLKRI